MLQINCILKFELSSYRWSVRHESEWENSTKNDVFAAIGTLKNTLVFHDGFTCNAQQAILNQNCANNGPYLKQHSEYSWGF